MACILASRWPRPKRSFRARSFFLMRWLLTAVLFVSWRLTASVFHRWSVWKRLIAPSHSSAKLPVVLIFGMERKSFSRPCAATGVSEDFTFSCAGFHDGRGLGLAHTATVSLVPEGSLESALRAFPLGLCDCRRPPLSLWCAWPLYDWRRAQAAARNAGKPVWHDLAKAAEPGAGLAPRPLT